MKFFFKIFIPVVGLVLMHNLLVAAPHPLKMSVAILTYDKETSKYEIELRIFIDDLIVGTGGKLPTKSVPWSTVAPKKNKVQDYLTDQFSISLNGVQQDLQFLDMKVEELTVAVKLGFASDLLPAEITHLSSKDSILTSTFVNQRNVLHIDLPDKARRSLLFNAHQQVVQIVY